LINARVISTPDQLDEQLELDVRRQRKTQLCVPSGKDQGSWSPSLDHFELYRTRTTQGSPRFERQEVHLAEPDPNLDFPNLDLDETVELRKLVQFGVPTDKNTGGISNPVTHLTCYYVRAPRFKIQDVEVYNQFGGPFRLTLRRPYTLCVPSFKQVVFVE
jgi:hypothetical protein